MDLTDFSRRRVLFGLSILGFCLLAFVIQTEVTQYLQKTLDFKSPYFIFHSFYMLVIPLDWAYRMVRNKSSLKKTYGSVQEQVEGLEREVRGDALPLQGNLFYFGRAVVLITSALTLGAYLWYVAVGMTSMSSLTAIYNTSCFFAYGFSVYGGLEAFNKVKAFAVVLSVVGVVIISLLGEGADGGPRSTIAGNMFGVASALLIGLFEVLYKKYAVSKTSPTALLANFVTGYIGMVTFSLFWLPIPFLHLAGVEPFALPTGIGLTFLMVNAVMGVLYNAGLMLLISITSPTFASVGIMTTIPVIGMVDSILLKKRIPLAVWLGGFVIILGFLILTRETLAEETRRTRQLNSHGLEDEPSSLSLPEDGHQYSQILSQSDPTRRTGKAYTGHPIHS
ncbi:hypothetical protein L0F63_000488 [Massospora cicadina]|nr:hypothetical protein L0F63_000488 [Massospora cicadina]